jgi:hypothetical protein
MDIYQKLSLYNITGRLEAFEYEMIKFENFSFPVDDTFNISNGNETDEFYHGFIPTILHKTQASHLWKICTPFYTTDHFPLLKLKFKNAFN